jgi:hypothetical protein
MSDEQTGTPAPTTPEPEEGSPPADTSAAPAQAAPSAAAAAMPAPPPRRLWDRPSRGMLLIVLAVFGVWAIAATAFAFAGHRGNGFRLNRGSMNSRRFDGMMGEGNRMGGGMMNGKGGAWVPCPNGVRPPQGVNPSNAPSPVAPSSGSTGAPLGPGTTCWIAMPGSGNGWSVSGP